MIKIALDGPAGAGKSSLADAIAEKTGIIHVDTGALYRAIGLHMIRKGLPIEDNAGFAAELQNISIDVGFLGNRQSVLLNGQDVTDLIRTPDVSQYASAVSAVAQVRDFLLGTQRKIASLHSVIMDGRDIGTVILPDADVKIFLIASAKTRAFRRYTELVAKGVSTTLEKVLSDTLERDTRDSTRAVAPLRAADDAVVLDNTDMNFSQSLNAALEIIREKTGCSGYDIDNFRK